MGSHPGRSRCLPTRASSIPLSPLLFALCLLCVAPAVFHDETSAGEPRSGRTGGGLFSELRLGLVDHDMQVFRDGKERGADIIVEALFATPFRKGRAAFLTPRPHLGASINTRGDTSHAYTGFTWDFGLPGRLFLNVSLGVSVHDGDLSSDRADVKEFGSRFLIRESVDVGYPSSGRHAVSLFIDHSSNAGLASRNDGLQSIGFRVHHRF
jgi:lipid A 3-O-deacylase